MTKGKHNYKLTEEDRTEIITSYYLNRSKENVSDLCQRFGISSAWLYEMVKSKKGQEILDNHIKESRKNLSKKLDVVINKTINKLNNALETEDIKAIDYAKILGITYDKSRLESNLSTSNKEVKISIKIE